MHSARRRRRGDLGSQRGDGPPQHQDHRAALRARSTWSPSKGREDFRESRRGPGGVRRLPDAERIREQAHRVTGGPMTRGDFVESSTNLLAICGEAVPTRPSRNGFHGGGAPLRNKGSRKGMMAPRGRFELPRRILHELSRLAPYRAGPSRLSVDKLVLALKGFHNHLGPSSARQDIARSPRCREGASCF